MPYYDMLPLSDFIDSLLTPTFKSDYLYTCLNFAYNGKMIWLKHGIGNKPVLNSKSEQHFCNGCR